MEYIKGPCKRTQQVPTTPNIVGCRWPTMLRPLKFDMFQTVRNKCQHCCGSMQTEVHFQQFHEWKFQKFSTSPRFRSLGQVAPPPPPKFLPSYGTALFFLFSFPSKMTGYESDPAQPLWNCINGDQLLIGLITSKAELEQCDQMYLASQGADPGFSEGGFGQTSAYII